MKIHLRTEYVRKEVAEREIFIEDVRSIEFNYDGISFVKDEEHYEIEMDSTRGLFLYLNTWYDFCFVRD